MDPALIGEASKFLGESPENTQSAINSVAPSLLGGLMGKASQSGGASALMNLLNDGGFDGSILNNLGGIFGGGNRTNTLMNAGSSLLSSVLGDKLGPLAGLISSASGVSSRSSNSLLSMLMPVVMGLLGKVKNEGNLDANGLQSLLMSQKDFIQDAAPAGLASALGFASFDNFPSGDGLIDKVEGVVGSGMDAGKNVVGSGKNVVGSGIDAGKNVVGSGIDAGKNVVGSGMDAGKKVVGSGMDAGKKVAGGVTDAGGAAADLAGDTAKKGGNLIMKLLPLILLGLAAVFLLPKMCGTDATNVVGDAANTVGTAAGNAADAAENAAGTAVDAAGNAVDAAGDAASNAADATRNAANNAADATRNAANNAADATRNAAGDAKDAAGNIIDKTKAAASNAADATKNAANDAANAVGNAADATADAAKDVAGGVANMIKFPPGTAQAAMFDYLEKGEGNGNFDFKNIKFLPGGKISPTSVLQINDIGKLLKNFPKVGIQISGKDGAKSLEQANSIKEVITKAGISGSRITTAAGTGKNVSIKVTKK